MRSRVGLAGIAVLALGCGSGAGVPPPGGRGGAAGGGGAAGASGAAGAAGRPGSGGASGTGGTAGAAGSGGGTAGAAGSTGGSGGGAGKGGAAGSGSAGSGAAGSSGHDAGADAAIVTCDPLVQTTCPADQRCTWVATAPSFGYPACLPDGTVDQGGACAAGAYGPSTGFDACKRGLACANGQCQPICKTSPDSCGAHFVCTNYSSVFSSGGTTLAGVCAPRS